MTSPAKPRLAMMASELTEFAPRGVARVARALAEQFASLDVFESYCITTHIIRDEIRPRFICEGLQPWLARHPLEQRRSRFLELKDVVWQCLPQFAAPAASDAYQYVVKQLRHVFHGTRASTCLGASCLNPATDNGSPILGLDDLDFLLIVHPCHPISSFDLVSDRCLLTTILHDAIPMRLGKLVSPPAQLFAGAIRRMGMMSGLLPCDSEHTRADIRTFFGEDLWQKCAVVPLGHDCGRFASRAGDEEAKSLLHSVGVEPGRAYFVFVGSIEYRKNIANILRASEILAQDRPSRPFDLLIIGDRKTTAWNHEILRRVRRQVKVHLPGYVPGRLLPVLVQRSQALVFPSLFEGFGLPILEAMSARTRVITSNLSALPEVAGQHAVYCDPYKPESIADAMHRVLVEPPAVRESCLAAAAVHASKFTWENSARRLADLMIAAKARRGEASRASASGA